MEEYRGQMEEALARLAEAQAHTEAALQELARRCESVVCDIGEIAYIVLYDVLKRGFGWEVGVLELTWQQWDGEPSVVDLAGSPCHKPPRCYDPYPSPLREREKRREDRRDWE